MGNNRTEIDQYIAPDGEVYALTRGRDRWLLSFTGFGMPGITYLTDRGPIEQGETPFDYRLQPRILQLIHRVQGCSRDDYWDRRGDLLNALRPNRQLLNTFEPGTYRKIFKDGSRRDIRAFIAQGPAFAARDTERWDEWNFTEVLRLVCHDPVFTDPDQKSISFALASFDQLVFPVTIDAVDQIQFGSESILESGNIEYLGTFAAFPTIVITGPFITPRVTNDVTGEKIELTYNISAGEVVTISTEPGNKTVTNNLNVNLIGTVTTDSDLATFHIEPDPGAPGGINTITVFGGGLVPGVSAAEIFYFDRYIGI